MSSDFLDAKGMVGIGSDIKWCGRWHGGKFCQLCRHYVVFEEWTKNWNWYYLIEWKDGNWAWDVSRSNFKYRFKGYNGQIRGAYGIGKYNTKGLSEADLIALFRKGCRLSSKCKCVRLAQRGHWYCPTCYKDIEALARQKQVNIHDIMITDRDELKAEFLIMRLSGII